MSYGNGTSVKYDYDTLDRVEKIWYKESGASQKAHPLVCNTVTVRMQAERLIVQAGKYIGKSYINGQISDLAFGGLSAFSSWYVNAITDRMLGR